MLFNGAPVKFHLITSWEVLEHIATPDLLVLFDNIQKHLEVGGYLIASTTCTSDIHEGIELHQTKWENHEWRAFVEKKYPDLEALLRPVAESLAEDIRRTLSLYGGVASEEGIRTIYVTGGAAKIRGLCGILAEKLGVPVQLADPFHGFRLDDKINKAYLGESASQLGIGVGLAIRRPGDK